MLGTPSGSNTARRLNVDLALHLWIENEGLTRQLTDGLGHHLDIGINKIERYRRLRNSRGG